MTMPSSPRRSIFNFLQFQNLRTLGTAELVPFFGLEFCEKVSLEAAEADRVFSSGDAAVRFDWEAVCRNVGIADGAFLSSEFTGSRWRDEGLVVYAAVVLVEVGTCVALHGCLCVW